MGTIKMIWRLYQLGDRSSHLVAGQFQSGEEVSVGVGPGGGPGLFLMQLRQKAERERLRQDELRGSLWLLLENLANFCRRVLNVYVSYITSCLLII